MKQICIFLLMCLTSFFAQAQVLTSETISKVYNNAVMENSNELGYDALFDANGRIAKRTVYKKTTNRKGRMDEIPSCYCQYEYYNDGLLKSLTKYIWRDNAWKCVGKYDYTLFANLYTITFSEWNQRQSEFGKVSERVDYLLSSDGAVNNINYIKRLKNSDVLYLDKQISFCNPSKYPNRILTQN